MIRQIKYLGVPGCDFTLLAHARVNNHAKIAVKGGELGPSAPRLS
jgi:hypothetical protein